MVIKRKTIHYINGTKSCRKNRKTKVITLILYRPVLSYQGSGAYYNSGHLLCRGGSLSTCCTDSSYTITLTCTDLCVNNRWLTDDVPLGTEIEATLSQPTSLCHVRLGYELTQEHRT